MDLGAFSFILCQRCRLCWWPNMNSSHKGCKLASHNRDNPRAARTMMYEVHGTPSHVSIQSSELRYYFHIKLQTCVSASIAWHLPWSTYRLCRSLPSLEPCHGTNMHLPAPASHTEPCPKMSNTLPRRPRARRCAKSSATCSHMLLAESFRLQAPTGSFAGMGAVSGCVRLHR